VLPHALDGLDLGRRVLELGPGYGASTRPLAARARSLTVLEYDPLLAARLRAELGTVRAARVLRPGGVFAGTDSRPSLRWRLIHLGDTCTPVDPGTLPGRLGAAGFTRVAVDANERLVRFAAYAPGAESEARHDAAA